MAKLTPVDFDPFASGADFTGVSASASSSERAAPKARYTPVDFDPFAEPATAKKAGYGEGIVNALKGLTNPDAPLLNRIGGVQQAITPDILLGAQGRGFDLLGSGVRGVANIAEPIGDALETAIPLSGLTPEQIQGEAQLQPMLDLADILKGGAEKLAYKDGATWEDVKADPFSMDTPQFMAEQAILSTPDMAASVASLPAYILGRTEEIGERRVANDGREGMPGLPDLLASLPAATVESLLERFATKRLPVAAGGGSAAARVATETGVQAVTEAAEEGAANLGESLGTKRGVDTQELLDAMGAGALTGGGLGAATRVATEVAGRPGETRPGALDPEMLAEGAAALEAANEAVPPPAAPDPAPVTPAETAQEAPQRAPEREAVSVPAAEAVAEPEPVPQPEPEPDRRVEQRERRKLDGPAEVSRSEWLRNAEEAGLELTPEQVDRLAPKAKIDNLTGFHDASNDGEIESEVGRAIKHVAETRNPAVYVSGDIVNLGGLNKHFGDVKSESDRHVRAMSDIFREEVEALGGDVSAYRTTKGDEVGAIVSGVDKAGVDLAVTRAEQRIDQYVATEGLDTVPRGKPAGRDGTGIHFGTSAIFDGADPRAIINDADLNVGYSKKGKTNVNGISTGKAGPAAPEGQAGGTGSGQAENAGRNGAQAPSVPAENASSQGGRTSLKNEVTDAERAAGDREAILRDTTIDNRSTVESAQAALAADSRLGEKTATRLANSREAGTLADSGVLLVDRMRLMKERAELESVAADEAATPQDRAQAIIEIDALENKITANDLAAVQVGTEAARILQLRQRIINDDYTIENMERRERVRKQRPLTADERAAIKAESSAVQAAIKAADASDARLEQAAATEDVAATYKQLVREMAAELGVGRPARKRGPLLERLKASADESRKWLTEAQPVKSRKGQSGAAMDPRAFFHLARIGAYHIANGAQNLTDWLARMRADIGAKLFGESEPALADVYEAAKLQHEAAGGGDPVAKAMKAVGDDLTHANVYNIARAHIAAGVQGEGPVMAATLKTLQAKFPKLTERDVRVLFADYGRARFPSKDADAREARRLKTLVRLQESIDRLREGKPALRTGVQRDKADAEIRQRQRQRQLNDLLKLAEAEAGPSEARLATYQQARASNLRNQIEDLNREIETGEKKTRPAAPADNAEVAGLRAERDRLKAELKRLDEIANPPLTEEQKYQKRRGTQLQKALDATLARIAAGDYARNVKPEPRELTKENQRLHYQVQEAKAAIARRQLADDAAARPALKKVFGYAGESLNAARSVMLSFDDSFLLNQGGLYVASRPWKAPALVAKSMRAFFSPEYASATERDIKKRENYPLYVKSGLPLVGEASDKVANQDEVYDTRWLEKFTGQEIASSGPVAAGAKRTRNVLTAGLRASQRAYNAAANQIRADWFDAIHNSAANGNAMTKEELKDISRIVSVMTGRSSIKDVQQAAGLMSKMFLAWHWTASRFQTVLGTPVWQASPRMKKYMAMEYGRVMTNLAVLQAALYFGAMVYSADHDEDDEDKPLTDFDPRSGNFMKFRFGDTWVGLSAGIGPTLAFLTRMVTGETMSKGKIVPLRKKGTLTQLIDWSQGRKVVEKKPNAFNSVPNVVLDWYHSRSSPAANYVLSAARGANAAKQEFDPARDALGMVTPINFDDVMDIVESNGPAAGPAMLAWRFFGGNTDFRDPNMKFGEREPLPWETTDKEKP